MPSRTTATPKRTRGSRILPEEKVRIALAYFEGIKGNEGRRQPTKVLEEKLHHPASVIYRIVAECFRNGWIDVRSRLEVEGPGRDRQLEKLVKSRFTETLREVIVVRGRPANYEDLGRGMANYMASGQLLRDGDKIGLGSGRGVRYTLEVLQAHIENSGPFFLDGIEIMSLAGFVGAARSGLWLDADEHVYMVAKCFKSPRLHTTVNALVLPDSDTLSQVRKGTHLAEESWAERCPDIALVGVDSVREDHRFYKLAKEAGRDPILSLIRSDLEQLINVCEPFKMCIRDSH